MQTAKGEQRERRNHVGGEHGKTFWGWEKAESVSERDIGPQTGVHFWGPMLAVVAQRGRHSERERLAETTPYKNP